MSESRRKFTIKLLTVLAAVPLLGIIACKKKDELTGCTTSDDILGPFYREDSPERTNLNVKNQVGTELTITGSIFTEDCLTPLNNAKIEIWHANDSGDYDNSTAEFEFRGTVNSDPNGKYNFTTIVPGKYLNGSNYRPSHVHFKISVTGHEELVTQLYFDGDSDIDADPWASDKDAEKRIIILNEDVIGKKSGIFDITMQTS